MLTTVEGTDYILPEKALSLSDARLEPFLPEHLRDKSVYGRNGQKAPDDATWQAMRQNALDRQRRQLMEDVMGFLILQWLAYPYGISLAAGLRRQDTLCGR